MHIICSYPIDWSSRFNIYPHLSRMFIANYCLSTVCSVASLFVERQEKKSSERIYMTGSLTVACFKCT